MRCVRCWFETTHRWGCSAPLKQSERKQGTTRVLIVALASAPEGMWEGADTYSSVNPLISIGTEPLRLVKVKPWALWCLILVLLYLDTDAGKLHRSL